MIRWFLVATLLFLPCCPSWADMMPTDSEMPPEIDTRCVEAMSHAGMPLHRMAQVLNALSDSERLYFANHGVLTAQRKRWNPIFVGTGTIWIVTSILPGYRVDFPGW